jgi:hypothetical protein
MTMKTEEFGILGTRQDQMIYTLIEEQRKTNALLEKLIQPPVVKSNAALTEAINVKITSGDPSGSIGSSVVTNGQIAGAATTASKLGGAKKG